MAGRPVIANVPCPHCGYAYSRQHHSGVDTDGYKRKRRCLNEECKGLFVTYEVYAADLVLLRALRKYAETIKAGKPFFTRRKNNEPRRTSEDTGTGKASS